MSFFDLFRINKIKDENSALKARINVLEKNLSDLGFTEYAQTNPLFSLKGGFCIKTA